MRNRPLIPLLAGFALLGLLPFAWLVWPTLYRYEYEKIGPLERPLRINRLTGETEYFSGSTWHKATATPTPLPLPSDELNRLQTSGSFMSYGYIKLELYNGSTWTITSITAFVTVRNASGGVVLSRSYAFTQLDSIGTLRCEPHTVKSVRAAAGHTFQKGETWSFSLSSAEGYPPPP